MYSIYVDIFSRFQNNATKIIKKCKNNLDINRSIILFLVQFLLNWGVVHKNLNFIQKFKIENSNFNENLYLCRA